MIIRTGAVYETDSGYVSLDTSWDRRGSCGRFKSAFVIHAGSASELAELVVSEWEDLSIESFPAALQGCTEVTLAKRQILFSKS